MSKKKIIAKPIQQTVSSKPVVSVLKEWDALLAKYEKHFLILLAVIALTFRVVYFQQLNEGPCIWQHKMVESDMHFYDEWAKYIAAGHWQSDTALHQYGQLNQWIAESYLKSHPDEVQQLHQQLGADAQPEALGKLLWKRWDGGKIMHQDPLYVYIVAVVYKIFGADVRFVFVLQMLLGIGSIFLIYFITRNYFGITAAFISGCMAVFCGPMLFYELVLLRESMIIFAGLLLVFLTERALNNSASVAKYFTTGIAVGLCMLLKSTFVLFMLLLLFLMILKFKKERSLLIKNCAVVLAGVLLIYVPLLIRNASVGVPLFSQNTVGSLTVISSNDVAYKPEQSYMINIKSATDILAQTNGDAWPSLKAAVATHPSALSYLTLIAKKFALVFHWYEFPNNKNFYYFRIHAPVLWYSFVNWLVVAPLAIIGLLLAFLNRKKLWPLYLLLLMHLLLLVFFLVLSRYRIPLFAAMIPFAAYALVSFFENLKSNTKMSFIIAAAAILLTVWVGRDLPEGITKLRAMDYHQPYLYYYEPMIKDYLAKGDKKAALATMENFMSYQPDALKDIDASSTNLNSYQLIFVQIYAGFYKSFSELYDMNGDKANASQQQKRYEELAKLASQEDQSFTPDNLLNKAAQATDSVQRMQLYSAAIEAAKSNLIVNANDVRSYYAISEGFKNLGMYDSSLAALQQIIKIKSDDYNAYLQMGTIYGRYKNDALNAKIYFEKSRELKPDNSEMYVNLGIVYIMLNQNEKAVEMMQKAAELNPSDKNNLRNLQMLLRNMGKSREADVVQKMIDG